MVRLALLLVLALAGSQPARAQAPEIVRDCPSCPEMVRIKAGSFTMGIQAAESAQFGTNDNYARPQHRVTFARDFWLGRYPVTRGEFAEFVTAMNFQVKADCADFETMADIRSWRSPGFQQTENDPVVCVNVDDAEAYIDWLAKKTGKTNRLPTEAEWEYSARAGTATAFYWGNSSADICHYANIKDQALRMAVDNVTWVVDCNDGYAFTAPVGSFPANPWGLHDMAGNVWQWTADNWVENYSGVPNDGSAWKIGPVGYPRVVRGGSWPYGPHVARAGSRYNRLRNDRTIVVGFRIAKTD